MGSYFATGPLAKAIASKKRTRAFWNVWGSIGILICLLGLLVIVYPTISEHVTYDSEQIFVDYNSGWLITDIDGFEIPEKDRQEIEIYKLIQTVKTGEKITLTISDLSGELLEIRYKDEVVYKKAPASIVFVILSITTLVFPLLGVVIFELIVTNIKNPGRRIDKLQKTYLLRFYK